MLGKMEPWYDPPRHIFQSQLEVFPSQASRNHFNWRGQQIELGGEVVLINVQDG